MQTFLWPAPPGITDLVQFGQGPPPGHGCDSLAGRFGWQYLKRPAIRYEV